MNKIKILKLSKIIPILSDMLEKCTICPRNCGINRLAGEIGYCGVDAKIRVYTAFLHLGEEPAISGRKGSGAIFFSGCNLKCVYCQNYKFSHTPEGEIVTIDELAQIMLKLQDKGAYNINLVTPTHYIAQICQGLLIAFNQGLNIPIVYNCSGYEKKETLDLLSGIIDIYLTDIKYADKALAKVYSNSIDYPEIAQTAAKTMYQQQPDLIWDDNLLKKGVIIRHLVLPNHVKNTLEILKWIKQNTPDLLTSIMFQFQPYFKAKKFEKLNRRVNCQEYLQVKREVENLDLNGWMQELDTKEELAGIHFYPSLKNL